MSDDGSTTVEKKGRGRPKSNGTQSVSIIICNVMSLFCAGIWWHLPIIISQLFTFWDANNEN